MSLRKSAKSLQKSFYVTFTFFILSSLVVKAVHAENYPVLSTEQQQWLGQKIFNNECAMQISCLTSWNESEDFPSLGLGHFIWYQENQLEIFDESFPALMTYFEEQNVRIPEWIVNSNYESPWQSRNEFLENYSGSELSELRSLLADTFAEQTAFIIKRFESALSKILSSAPENEAEIIATRFFLVANSHPPYGMYALIDYVNFKGEGTSINEQYAGEGWGLLQVLSLLSDTSDNHLENFVSSAKTVLQNRVTNAPQQRNEEQWLQGWFNRLDTYLPDTEPLAL